METMNGSELFLSNTNRKLSVVYGKSTYLSQREKLNYPLLSPNCSPSPIQNIQECTELMPTKQISRLRERMNIYRIPNHICPKLLN